MDEREKKEIIQPPDIDETEAGIEDFTQFGAMDYIFSFCKGDPSRISEVLNTAWCDVHLFRFMNIKINNFTKRLHEIKTRTK